MTRTQTCGRQRGARLNGSSHPFGSLELALSHGARLLLARPALAAEQAAEILKVAPDHAHALLLLAVAQRSCGNTDAALENLRQLCRRHACWAKGHYELGVTLGCSGRTEAAIAALRQAVALQPDLPDAWLALGDHLIAIGDTAGADAAYTRHIKVATRDPRLLAPASALAGNRIPEAEQLLRAYLGDHPNDVAALRMLAEVAARLRRYAQAETLLERCLELSPSFDVARHNYATVLNRQGKASAALAQVERLLAKEHRNRGYRNLKGAVLANLGDYAGSAQIYAAVLEEFPNQPRVWMSYGHSLKTSGHVTQSIAAYRRALALLPTLGEAYWSLANLKTYRFSDSEVAAMTAALARTDLSDDARLHLEFSLGKVLEDQCAYRESFQHYETGNALRRKSHPYRAGDNTRLTLSARTLFTRQFFTDRAGWGAPASDPIFIVGLPRSGSTLLEQILASHSLVEGTMELQAIPQIARELNTGHGRHPDGDFLQGIAALGRDDVRALGERYLERTRPFRKSPAPSFIDKLPNNWLYVGLIHLILPNARIIDARRHPLASCFSCFKQHFARGQSFTYGLEDLGRYYRDYVRLMDHYDQVLPGRVHRVLYEDLVAATDAEVGRLLAHCGLPFEESCLRFYENPRAVRTASSQQVRQPIFRDGLDHWRHYEPWLTPLEQALGSALAAYPQVPNDLAGERASRRESPASN
jgi:tetratricopeptide (TPR) repeat protein